MSNLPDGTPLSVRLATDADLPALQRLVRAGAARGLAFASEQRRRAWSERAVERLREALGSKAAAVLVAVEGGEPVGVGVVYRNGNRCYLCLLNAARDGAGIGRALTDARLAHAREQWGCTWALCEVFEANQRALRAVLAAGFTPAASRPAQSLADTALILLARAL